MLIRSTQDLPYCLVTLLTYCYWITYDLSSIRSWQFLSPLHVRLIWYDMIHVTCFTTEHARPPPTDNGWSGCATTCRFRVPPFHFIRQTYIILEIKRNSLLFRNKSRAESSITFSVNKSDQCNLTAAVCFLSHHRNEIIRSYQQKRVFVVICKRITQTFIFGVDINL